VIFGSGIFKGLAVTLKNLVNSYFRKPEDGGLFTVEYPERRIAVKEAYRNFPFLVYDGTQAEPRCTACDICAKECPPKCITVVREFDKDAKPLKKPAVFDIDVSVCMNCGLCEEVCPFDAIYMDHDYEVASPDRQQKLLFHKEDLLKPAEYLRKIRPVDAAAIEKRRREAEEKKKAAAQAAAAKKNTP
jgi:NADH-quinone oxidoreductase subunit I